MADGARAIAIVTDDPGWHGRRLAEAFCARGYSSGFASLAECSVCVRDGAARFHLPGFERQAPAAVFVRGIPGGSLEQITRRLTLLHGLRAQGTVVCNDARAIERTVDKAMTSVVLAQARVPTPDTWVVESATAARAVVEAIAATGQALVLKPLFGSQGEGLRLLRSVADLEAAPVAGGVYYLQRFVERGSGDWCDYRVFVIAGCAVAAMRRRSRHWVTNRAQGAVCEPVALDARLRGLAERAAAAIDIDYTGVDLLETPDGELTVIEVNGVPAWMGLQGVTRVDIAAALAAQVVARIEARAAAS
jgi:RimK family alpha-L-glutamate ligase